MSVDASALDDPRVLAYRLQQAEGRIDKKADQDDVTRLETRMERLERAVWYLLAGIVSSAILVSFTLFATLGSHLAG